MDWGQIFLTALTSSAFTAVALAGLGFLARSLVERWFVRNLEKYKAELRAAQERRVRRLDFIERQLTEFYSPMVGCLQKIQAKRELRFEISKASDPAWKKIVAQHPQPFTDHEKYFEPFKRSIMYDNNELREEIIPLYDRMVSIFTQNLQLAESTTREWYSELYRFVDLWHRWLDESIPVEVIQEMDHTERRLEPFYQDLENHLEGLRQQLAGE
jgi:hypothetical protein